MAKSEMWRSVSQLLFSYLPDKTVSWEDGAGIVRLGTPRLGSAWPASEAIFVLDEIRGYLTRWRDRGGEVDRRFPPIASAALFTVGPPRGIGASFLSTALYCRECFRFLPRVRADGSRLVCPDCQRQTLRQLGYVFVHGCGEIVVIKDSIPRESNQNRGTIFNARIRCSRCPDGGVLRLDARSDRLSALRVFCSRCNGEAVGRPLARCPRCLPHHFRELGTAGAPTQLGLRSAMRITRHSANNAYYPHSLTVLRLDRPRVVQDVPEQEWLMSLVPAAAGMPIRGIGQSLVELADRLRQAESRGDLASAVELRAAIAAAVTAPQTPPVQQFDGVAPPPLAEDVRRSATEAIALLSTVRRSPVVGFDRARPVATAEGLTGATEAIRRLGLRRIELVSDLPVIASTFGYSRRSPDPTYVEQGGASPFPTTLRPFPVLDDEAARILGRPQAMGTVPILAREGSHEGLAIYLDPLPLFRWLARHGVDVGNEGLTERDRLTRLMTMLEPIDRNYDDIWQCPTRRLVYGVLHSVSHCAMKAVSRLAGLEAMGVAEYLFLPLLCTVIYATGSVQLGGIAAAVQHRLMELLEAIQEEALRCIYDPDCLHRHGACHGCIHVPEIGCRVFNHGLSRSFLVGGAMPWTGVESRVSINGFWEETAA